MHVEPQRIKLTRIHASLPLGAGHVLRIAGIKRRAVRIARPRPIRFVPGHQARNLRAAFEARIDQPHRLELDKGRTVVVGVFGLAPYRLFAFNPEPRQVFIDRRFIFRPAADGIDVLDTQQQPPTFRARHISIEKH